MASRSVAYVAMIRTILKNWNVSLAVIAVAFSFGSGHASLPQAAGLQVPICTPVNQVC